MGIADAAAVLDVADQKAMTGVERKLAARQKTRGRLPDGVEAIIVQREDSGFYSVTLNIGHGDDVICDSPQRDWALGIAHALDVVFGCGVYEDGELL